MEDSQEGISLKDYQVKFAIVGGSMQFLKLNDFSTMLYTFGFSKTKRI